MDLLHDPRFRLPKDVELQTIGAAAYPLWAGPVGWQTACHNKSVIDAILTSRPYPVRGMYVSGVNIAVMYPDTRRTLEALRSLDFLCVAAHTMTPMSPISCFPRQRLWKRKKLRQSDRRLCHLHGAGFDADRRGSV
jgi:thiosulfate reductase / polysulfide reductase chain A